MKVLLLIFLLFVPIVTKGNANQEMRIQMLDAQIERLTQQRDKKYAELKQCEKTTKGFKIAGITTLVATGVGIAGNIVLAEKLKEAKSGGGGKTGKGIQDKRSQKEKNDESSKLLCEMGEQEFC